MEPAVDWERLDATSDEEIADQEAADDAEARRDAANYIRNVRAKTGLSQVNFAKRIAVPVGTLHSWERGESAPAGPARALLRIIDRVPETAINALAG